MRVGVVTTSYPRAPGDPAGSFVAGFARWLAGRGHQVEVVAAGPGASTDGAIRVARVPGRDLFYGEGAPERLERSLVARARAPIFAAALARRVLAEGRDWDLVVSHWLLPSGLAASLLGRPHLAVAHSADVHLAARTGVADGLALALRRASVSFSGAHLRDRLLAAVRVPSLRRSMEARSFVQPMGVDVAPRPARPPGRTVGFLGRLVPIKGVDVLLASLAGTDLRLLVGGDGPERARLEERARDLGVDAVFLGEVARERVLHAADVIALPSIDLPGGRTEGTPVVALEAMAAGVPLVASDVGGVRAATSGAALLVPPGDAGALAGAIRSALARPEPTRLARGRALAAAYHWEIVGPRLLGSV